jgi:peptidyl-prolyl cis-trans isomerase A (cyclophilin A)
MNDGEEKETSMHPMAKGSTTLLALVCAVALGLGIQQAGAQANKEKLMNPAALTEKAPETFQAKFETTKGTLVVEVTRAWSPNGADRFYNLVKNGYYDDCGFYRVIPGFMAQFGLHGDPKVNTAWRSARIKDDPVVQSNKRGYVSFATSGPNSRTTSLFINYSDRNTYLDASGFSPFGKVNDEGMKVAEAINAEYRETPEQGSIHTQGNAYLKQNFPRLDYIKSAVIVNAAGK